MPLVMGDHILVSLNILGTCLEHDPGYDFFLGFPFIANSYILMSLNIELKIHYIVDVDAIKVCVPDKIIHVADSI